MSTDLVSWLRSQIDADEAVARATHEPDAWWSLADLDGLGGAVHRTDAAFIASQSPTHVLRSVAAHRAILAEHVPTLRTVEWPHDTTGLGEALCCPRCQNAEHTYWNPPIGGAGVLPEGFVAPYVLAPCNTLRALASIYEDRPGFDPSWRPDA